MKFEKMNSYISETMRAFEVSVMHQGEERFCIGICENGNYRFATFDGSLVDYLSDTSMPRPNRIEDFDHCVNGDDSPFGEVYLFISSVLGGITPRSKKQCNKYSFIPCNDKEKFEILVAPLRRMIDRGNFKMPYEEAFATYKNPKTGEVYKCYISNDKEGELLVLKPCSIGEDEERYEVIESYHGIEEAVHSDYYDALYDISILFDDRLN